MVARQFALAEKHAGRGRTAKPALEWLGKELSKLDPLIHEWVRLGVVNSLAANDRLTLDDLRQQLGTTTANVKFHTRKLEDAQYIACQKSAQGRMPRTEYRLTAQGQRALERYLNHMEALIQAMRER